MQQSPVLLLNVKNEFMCGTRTVKVTRYVQFCGLYSFNRPRTDICFGTSCARKRQAR